MKDLALLLVRIVTGGTLVAHGYPKLFGGEGKTPPQFMTQLFGQNFPKAVETGGPASFAKVLESKDIPYPQAAAYLAGAAEFGGGLALLLGFRTRLAALIVMVNMVVAIQKMHWQTGHYGQGGYEFPLQLLSSAAALFLAGPGAISVDGIIGGARHTAEAVGSGVSGASEALGSGARQATGAVASGGRRAVQSVASAVPGIAD